MNTPDTQTLTAVNVTDLLTAFPKQITEREYFVLGTLTGVEATTATFTGLGRHPKTGINPTEAGKDVLGAYALLSLAGAGGHVAVCLDGKVRVRTAAGAESVVTMSANGAEPALATVMGKDTDVNGLQAGTIIEGSSFTNTWEVSVTRVNTAQLTITLKHTTPATDQQWNGNVNVSGVVGHAMTVFVGNPSGVGTQHSGVVSSVVDAFASATTLSVDETAPVVSGFTIPGTGTTYDITISTFTVTEAGGTVYRAITEEDVAPAADSALWGAVGVTPSTYTILEANQSGSGSYTLYGWAKDGAGNVCAASVSDSITLTIA